MVIDPYLASLSSAECSTDAIHAPFVAGISSGPEGAYSVALSGGYDDDVDLGYALYVARKALMIRRS